VADELNLYTFDCREVEALRARAAAWRTSMPMNAPEGWSICPADPGALLAVFPALKLKPGVVLRAHQYRAGRDGNAVVWALPAGAAFPDPARMRGAREAEDPPWPPQAFDNVMDAIEGDGTPRSYLAASLFAREVGEFGASGHGVRWGSYQIIDARPWEPAGTLAIAAPIEIARSPEQWHVVDDGPGDWRPTVAIDPQDGEVTVILYAFSALGEQHVARLVDTYPAGSYTADHEQQEVAVGPAGYVH
jgi:hypothetical protein